MNKYVLGAWVALFLSGGISNQLFASSETSNKKVVLISIDGLRPEFYLDKKYQTPNLRSLMKKGAYAQSVVPVYPTLTYPNHTSLVTGVQTGKHGILSNSLFDFKNGPSPAWYWEADHIQAPTLFDMTKEAGMTSASVRWPVTLFAKNITYNVPEIFGMKGFYEGDGFDLTVKYTEPQLMTEILQNTTLKRYDGEEQMDFWVAEATAHLLKTRQPDFLAVHLANVDHIEHGAGREAPEVEQAVAEVDHNIGLILSQVDTANTCVIVTGDHGFIDVSQKIAPNVLFASKGWISTSKAGAMNWQVIAQASGAQAAIYVKSKKMIPQVMALLKANEHLGFKVLDRKTLDQYGAYPDAAMAIEGQPGFTISGSTSGELVGSSGNFKGNHGFSPTNPQIHTGLIASGCGEKKARSNLQIVHLVDVTPTILKVLNIRTRNQFDGKPLF